MSKGGKVDLGAPLKKKKATKAKKTPEKKADKRALTEAVGSLLEAVGLLSRAEAHIKAAANRLNIELELGLDSTPMSATEAQNYTQPQLPLKVGDVPEPGNGSTFTADELANPGVMTRQVLATILKKLGKDPTGLMPPGLRTSILEAQGGRQEMGDCAFSGDEGVPVKVWVVEDEAYLCGPKVLALLSGKSAKQANTIILKLLEGEIEV